MKQDPDGEEVVMAPGTVQDLDRILAIEQESFASPWTRRMLEAELEGSNPFSRVVTARLGEGAQGEILGYVCFWVVFDELRLMDLAVASNRRRQGVARALVRYALACGREAGAERALLEVRVSNAAARSLYEGLGFRQTALRARYYSRPEEDAVLMEKASLGEPAEAVLFSQTGGGE